MSGEEASSKAQLVWLPEASAGSLPIHALGTRPGAQEAAAEFDRLFDLVLPTEVPHGV